MYEAEEGCRECYQLPLSPFCALPVSHANHPLYKEKWCGGESCRVFFCLFCLFVFCFLKKIRKIVDVDWVTSLTAEKRSIAWHRPSFPLLWGTDWGRVNVNSKWRPNSYSEISFHAPWGVIAAKAWGPEDGKPFLGLHGWDNANTFDKIAPLRLGLVSISQNALGYLVMRTQSKYWLGLSTENTD